MEKNLIESKRTKKMTVAQIVDALRKTAFEDIYDSLGDYDKDKVDGILETAALDVDKRTTIGEVMTKVWYGHKVLPKDPKKLVKTYRKEWLEMWHIISLLERNGFEDYVGALMFRSTNVRMKRPRKIAIGNSGGWQSVLKKSLA